MPVSLPRSPYPGRPPCVTYRSASAISSPSPTVAEKQTFGVSSVRKVSGEVRAAYGLDFREHLPFHVPG